MAAIPPGFDSSLPYTSDRPGDPVRRGHHDGLLGHLPATQQNLEVVGRLEPTGAFGNVEEEQIADVAVHKGFAYLNSWDDAQCQRGGTYVVDIRNPAEPKEIGFIPAQFPYYHGEGAHVVSINTPSFQGDVLAVNNETYGDNVVRAPSCNVPQPLAGGNFGGFDLYDVTNPANPVPLVMTAGDRDDDNNPNTAERAAPNAYHSVFVWQSGPRAFLVGTDNPEETDVDIFDITDPRAPVQVGDFDLDAMFPQIVAGENALGGIRLHHDVVVKQIGGRQVMLSDYWDAGYVQLDVTDPANPTLITDTTFSGADPLLPVSPTPPREPLSPEGNAHQGEFSFDNQFLLAADEDFGPYRLIERIGGADAVPQFGFAVPVDINNEPIPGLQIEAGDPFGPAGTRFIGIGCDPATIDPPTPTATIAVIERGTCTFEVKAQNAQDAGYEGFVIFNSNAAVNGCDTLINMQFNVPTTVTIRGVFVARQSGLRILGVHDPANYTCTRGGATTPAPPAGVEGETLELAAAFDGWGYAHLYDAQTSAHLEAFAIPEALDERYAEGDFGVLSIHEFAADPTENLAYASHYSAGMRVFRFDRQNGLSQVGAFIAPEGSDFWGVEQFTTPDGQRLIAGSDRDFGLYIFRYTGPGAAQKPVCSDTTVLVSFRGSVDVPLACSDANGNPLTQSRTSNPEGGTVADRPPGRGWVYTHTANRLGPAGSFTFKANDGAADSNTATASLVAVARSGGRCFNPFTGSRRRDVIVGSPFGDRIRSGRGRDGVGARAGADCLSGGAGPDRLAGQNGNDRLSGGARGDKLSGGKGRDRLSGNNGNDRLAGDAGNDRIAGGGGKNRLLGGAGNDQISARNGAVDRIRCGSGRDRVGADARDRVADDCEVVRR
jgi:Ca2+-binding RTX toxin-like protein